MSQLLAIGDGPFLLVKLAVGAFAAIPFIAFASAFGTSRDALVLTIYVALMLSTRRPVCQPWLA